MYVRILFTVVLLAAYCEEVLAQSNREFLLQLPTDPAGIVDRKIIIEKCNVVLTDEGPLTKRDISRILFLRASAFVELTVMDVFYYLHRGHEFEYIQRAMPTLSRDDFDAVVAYVQENREDLIEKDRRADELIRQRIQEQKAKGLSHEIDTMLSIEMRLVRFREKHQQKLAKQAENNGDHAAG